jgi:ribonucleoside-triphosphate reductase
MERVMQPSHLIKRDGRTVEFQTGRLACALTRAGQASGEFDEAEAWRLARLAALHLATQPCPGIEAVQDEVEAQLVAEGWWRTARAYVVHRTQHQQLRAQARTLVDVEASMGEYLDQKDWRIRANANQGYSLGGLILNVSGKVTANYWLNHVYSPEAGQATCTSMTWTC